MYQRPNYTHIPTFFKHWSFIWRYFFPMSIFNIPFSNEEFYFKIITMPSF